MPALKYFGKDFVMSWQKRSFQLMLGLPLTIPVVSYAINVGDTYVQSEQDQPLNATINVSNIDPSSFSVEIANSTAYQQMGLSKDVDINVSFRQTSSNGGQILLTTSEPIRSPFTDVVLNITNKGQTQLMPKTLLMPINNAQQIVTQGSTALVDFEPTNVVIGDSSDIELPVVNHSIDYGNETAYAERSIRQNNLETHDNLTISETRSVYPADTMPSFSEQGLTSFEQKPIGKTKYTVNNQPMSDETVVYVIQRNDNIWTIANRIAKKNKTDVNTVIGQIIANNPNVFPNNDPSKIQAGVPLQLPKYKVMPSQLSIKSAKEIQKNTRITAGKKPSKKKTTSQQTTTKRTTTVKPTVVKKKRKAEMTIIAPTQTQGSTQGSSSTTTQSTTTTTTTTTTSKSSDVVAKVQQKRQTTAQQATKVSQLNQSLAEAENRLKLQNSKLAQLEQRLKELNSQK